jgi:hypothetical protein
MYSKQATRELVALPPGWYRLSFVNAWFDTADGVIALFFSVCERIAIITAGMLVPHNPSLLHPD